MNNNPYKKISEELEIEHTLDYLELAKEWLLELNTKQKKPSQIFSEMDEEQRNIKIALARLPYLYKQIPEEVRDFSVLVYDYYATRSRWDEWIEFGEIGLKACNELNNKYSLGQVYSQLCNCLGIAHRMMNKFDEAMTYYQEALEKAERNEEKSDALTNMADIYRLRIPPDIEKALKSSKDAIKLAEAIGDKNRQAKAWEYRGLAYVGLSRKGYNDGINCYEQALALRKETENLPAIAKVLSNLSFVLAHRDNEEDIYKAVECYNQAYQIETELKNNQALGRLNGDIALAYNKLGQYEIAIKLLRKAEESNRKAKYNRARTLNQAQLLHSYLGLNNLEEALNCADYICDNQDKLTAFDCANLLDFSGMFVTLAKHQQERGNIEKAKGYCQFAINLGIATSESESLQSAKLLLEQCSIEVWS